MRPLEPFLLWNAVYIVYVDASLPILDLEILCVIQTYCHGVRHSKQKASYST